MHSHSDQLFILGLPNTGTSTLVGMVNSHPDILICYETWSLPPFLTRYGMDLVRAYPILREAFSGTHDLKETYCLMSDTLARRGIRYRYVGDKIISFTFAEMSLLEKSNVIYVTRPLEEWLVKREVRRSMGTDIDAKVPALHYLRCLASANAKRNWIRFTMHDVFANPECFFTRVSEKLNLDAAKFDREWWKSVRISSDPVKACMKWADVHPSSCIAPQAHTDVQTNLRPHPFWDDVRALGDSLTVSMESGISEVEKTEIMEQCIVLGEKYPPIPLQDLYADYSEKRHQPQTRKETRFIALWEDIRAMSSRITRSESSL